MALLGCVFACDSALSCVEWSREPMNFGDRHQPPRDPARIIRFWMNGSLINIFPLQTRLEDKFILPIQHSKHARINKVAYFVL